MTGVEPHRDPIDPVVGRTAPEWDAVIAGLPTVADPWPPSGPLVLVAPHPDDELLAAGATLAAASDAGTEVRVVAVTDGEMSHPHLDDAGRRQLVDRRLAETAAAYTAAGIVADRHRLSLPDGDTTDHADRLVEGLLSILEGAAACLAPWEADGHPDHDTCGRAALKACAVLGVPVFSFPVWSWNWDDPGNPAIPFDRAVRFPLSDRLDGAAWMARKRAGLATYTSQILVEDGHRPVLPASFVAHFTRSDEVFLRS